MMNKTTDQMNFWLGQFGKEYTDRNTFTAQSLNDSYVTTYGISRADMNLRFLDGLDRNIRILEVGCNIGLQLEQLQAMGFKNLYGIELQRYAVNIVRQRLENVDVIQGSALDLPFKDGYFDLVYTSGVLIHIAPADLPTVISEMVRCSKRYIWGLEYYANETTDVAYRGNNGYLWKAPFAKLFEDNAKGLKMVKEEQFPYITEAEKGCVDSMYLLEK